MLSLFWGFRLTIWNVKLDSKYKLKKFLSFRLTIWNVKIFDAMKKFTTKFVLD